MLIYGGDGNQMKISSAQFGVEYVYDYEEVKTVNVTTVLTNPIGQHVVINTIKEMMWPIVDLSLQVIPSHAVLNEPVNISVSMLKGDDVNVTYIYGDASLPVKLTQHEILRSVQSHTYTVVGNYTITVIAANIMGAITMTYDICVQKPVREGMFTVITNAPIKFPDTLIVEVLYNGILIDYPTTLSIMVDYGDGHVVEEQLLPLDNNSVTYSFDFAQPGVYLGSVKLNNLASDVFFPLQMNSVELIENVSMSVLWQPLTPRNASPKLGVWAHTYALPMNRPIIYDVRKSKGSPAWYEVYTENLSSGMVNVSTYDESPIRVSMSEAGDYNVTVRVKNDLSHESVSALFTIQHTADLSPSALSTSSTTIPGKPKLFSISLDSECVDCCMTVDFGDGSPLTYFSSRTNTNASCGELGAKLHPLSIPLMLNHTYLEEGAYDLSVTLKNPFTEMMSFTKSIAVSTRHCHQPELYIENQRSSFLDAEPRYKSVLSTTYAYTVLVCSDTLMNSKRWKIYSINADFGYRVKEIELSSISTRVTAQLIYSINADFGYRVKEIELSSISTRVTAQLILPHLFLDLGYYELEYSVSMSQGVDGVPFYANVSTFIQIIRCAEGGLCKQVTGGQQINPTNQLALFALCLDFICTFPKYHWDILYFDKFKFWRNIPDQRRYIKGVYGENSQGIGVSEVLFLDYPQVTQFQFSLSFEVKSGTSSAQTGFASLDAFVNKLPFGGTCSISPKYVSSAEMPFYVTCEDWRDDNGIQKYEIYASHGNSTALVYYSSHLSNTQIYLPNGHLHENFYISVNIRVVDYDNSYASWSLGKVRVERSSMWHLYNGAHSLFNDTHNMDIVLQGGEIKEVSKEILRRAAMFGELSSLVTESLAEESTLATDFKSAGLVQTDWDSYDKEVMRKSFNVTGNGSFQEAWRKYDAFRNEVSKVRTTMITALSNVGTGSIESLSLVATALDAVTVVYPELDRRAQETSIEITGRLVDQLMERTVDTAQKELVHVATNIFYSIENAFQGSVSQLLNPISSDFEQSRVVWDYDTNLESREPWLDTGEAVHQTLDNLQNFTNSKLQKQSSHKVVGEGLANAEKISKAVLNNMVPGDLPIEIIRNDIQVFLSKEIPSRLTNKTLSSGIVKAEIPSLCDLQPQNCLKDDFQEKIVSLFNVALVRNPFLYKSKVQDFKDPSQLYDSSVSKYFSARFLMMREPS
ncbi:hypothetical protein EB796_008704 [Bugula neritina]|uniref:PKD domain-containing protein n=1 Tax=Bugula neritina TaxID=10212 RepID=A0A7J7K2Z4_BUGNE|nr:hypothetical protein EB796_008704 [Bugula neritina]